MGFKTAELKADVLATHLATAGVTPTGDVLLDAGALDAHYKATLPPAEEMAECDCGGISPAALDACPYCGDGDAIDGDAPAPVVPDIPPLPEPEIKGPVDPEPEPEPEPEAETPSAPPPKKKAKVKAKAPVKAAKESKATTAPKGKAKAAKAPSKPKATPKTEVLPAKEAAALAKATPSTLSERNLDTQCKVIRKATKGAAAEFVKTARAFKEVADNDLWKLRVNDRGERAYTNFGQWAKTEFSVSSSYAYQMIRAVTEYSDDEIKQFGMGKIQVALRLPKDKAQALLDAGGTKAEMSERAKALQDGATDTPAPPKPKNPVTVAVIEQNIELPLYARGDAHTTAVRATSTDDDPWTSMEMENDTTMKFRVQQKDNGELVLHIETRRGGEA